MVQLSRRQGLQGLVAASAMVAWPFSAQAQDSRPLAMELFLRPGQLGNVQLSPDGTALLALRSVEGRSNLVVIDLQTQTSKLLTGYRQVDVSGARWINNSRILYTLGSRNTDVGFARRGFFSVNKDGSDPRDPKDTDSGVQFVARGAQADKNLVIVAETEGDGRHQALFRMDLLTSRRQRLSTGAPGHVEAWALDRQDQPRACITRTKDMNATFWIRPEPNGEWKALHNWTVHDPGVDLEGIDADEQLYVLHTPAGRDEQVLGRIDLRKAEWATEPLVALQGYDVTAGAVRFDTQGNLRSVFFQADRPRVMHADAKLDALQTAMEKEFPDSTVTLSPDAALRRVLVSVSSDVDPGRYFLYEEGAPLKLVGTSRPWLDPKRLAKTRFFRYTARDGLSIPAQLTLPPGAKPGEKHPLLVLHYGGPHVRAIAWGFDPMVQFLASRGYAVFMPAPRMSTGWGWRHHKAGWKQWGLGMQDDVTDGVLQLVKEGVADRDRLAIMGASYGGYLTMMGLAKNPELWRCGINWVGVTDIEHKFFSWVDYAGSDFAEHLMPHMVGDPVKDLEQLRRTSPVRRVAEIQAPVLLAYGGTDRRVPLVNGLAMRDALAAAGKPHEWVLYPDEGHGFNAPAAKRDFWTRIEKFLAEHMAPRAAG
ncbi:alpha/beta hydrolase family protein [Inhella gelatinilytica]|uniref:S9 family peptidase n=1 Tax=Inhella gelatinilytica TaxID=2795030 RepID=A0A931IXV3_9BURK|nr:S9 family peptidase [Inhella gelatinilytica]MBH9552008.1 S9 family peptidase [Inhella gelatinilytica]